LAIQLLFQVFSSHLPFHLVQYTSQFIIKGKLFWAMLRLIFLIGHSIALSSFLFTSSIHLVQYTSQFIIRRKLFVRGGWGYFLYLNRIVVKVWVTLQFNREQAWFKTIIWSIMRKILTSFLIQISFKSLLKQDMSKSL